MYNNKNDVVNYYDMFFLLPKNRDPNSSRCDPKQFSRPAHSTDLSFLLVAPI